MSDTDKKTSDQWDEEYTSTVGKFSDSIGIRKGGTTQDLTWRNLEAFKVAFSFRHCITAQSKFIYR